MSLISLFNDPFFSDFDRMFDEAFARRTGSQPQSVVPQSTGNAAPRVLRPKVDIHEDADKNLVTATFELPGVRKEDVSLAVHGGRLTVSGESSSQTQTEAEGGFVVRERRFGRFARTLPVPEGVQPEDVKAAMADGVLTVTFPRETPEQAPKKITIA